MENLNENICPHCGKSISPIPVTTGGVAYFFTNNPNTSSRVFVYKCPSCNLNFVSILSIICSKTGDFIDNKIEMIYPAPKQVFDDIISNLSPNFVKIYNQALCAESNSLDEIAGMGFRKAVEFLIKDYLIDKYPNFKEKFIKSPISQCIQNKTIEGQSNYMPSINSPYLNEISKRIIWLGNDETHYSRKHTDRDISDLKALIDIAIQHIVLENSTLKYINEIQPK